jgi:hypothetical protein
MTKEERDEAHRRAIRKYRKSKYGRMMERKRRRDNSPAARRSKRLTQVRQQEKKKCIVLSHYGKGGKAKCCWRGCNITDLDMLSLDHINNDGYRDKHASGSQRYHALIKENFPKGLQTLCMSHQWKKHMLNTRKDVLNLEKVICE